MAENETGAANFAQYKDLACHGFQFDSIVAVVIIQFVYGRKMYDRITIYTSENIAIECKVFIILQLIAAAMATLGSIFYILRIVDFRNVMTNLIGIISLS